MITALKRICLTNKPSDLIFFVANGFLDFEVICFRKIQKHYSILSIFSFMYTYYLFPLKRACIPFLAYEEGSIEQILGGKICRYGFYSVFLQVLIEILLVVSICDSFCNRIKN